MKFEVVEDPEAWIVCGDGEELARFREQDQALADAAGRLRECPPGERAYSFAVRYRPRG